MINVALVDDHKLLRNGLASVINSFAEYQVLFEADNGRQFTEVLNPASLPDIVLLDITMPEMNGYDTAAWLKDNYPQIKVLALTMLNDERSIIKMLRNGAKGYLLKDTELLELKMALDSVISKGIYINELLYQNIVQSMSQPQMDEDTERRKAHDLTDREKEFLQWLCSDKSYKEIATVMNLSPRTVDGYRDILFEKLKVASRVGLVIFAIRNGVVRV
ncbi:response regulator transcription factor [Sediminibacterium soli]|uniref:response regulator transcription factor n=1 Tax=Sediminibacterium soli TaxID=2698829 RepID=UPI00137B4854|nr:response regulator transcription factor [Sediminibacterium soli]NCI45310.1 response regulator transcription factor [Sediminibacterium soli]